MSLILGQIPVSPIPFEIDCNTISNNTNQSVDKRVSIHTEEVIALMVFQYDTPELSRLVCHSTVLDYRKAFCEQSLISGSTEWRGREQRTVIWDVYPHGSILLLRASLPHSCGLLLCLFS